MAPLMFNAEQAALADLGAAARLRTAVERQQREHRELVARLAFPVYGLDASWVGSRWFGGWGSSNGVVRRVELAHGDVDDEGAALLRVATHDPRARESHRLRRGRPFVDEQPFLMRNVAAGLAQRLWMAGAGYSEALRATFTAADPTAGWDVCALLVDGVETAFQRLSNSHQWVAVGAAGGLIFGIEARHIAPSAVRLVPVPDLEPYIAGNPN